MRTIEPNEVLDKDTLAQRLGISTRTVERSSQTGELPAPTYLGRQPRWLGSTVLEHLEKRQKRGR